MNLSRKLILAFAAVAAICALVGGSGWYGIVHTQEGLDEIGHHHLAAVGAFGDMAEGLNGIKSAERTMINPSLTLADRQYEIDNLKQRFAIFQEGFDQFDPMEKDPSHEQKWQAFKPAYQQWLGEHQQLVADVAKVKLDNVGELESILLGRHIDHINWVNQLDKAIQNGEQFTGQLDPSRCGLGKWLSQYQTKDQEFVSLMRQFEAPHKQLHQYGEEINAAISARQISKANALLAQRVKPTLKEIEGIFNQAVAYVADDQQHLEEARQLGFGSERAAFSKVMKALDDLKTESIEDSTAAVAEADSEAAKSKIISLVFILFGGLIALVFGWLIARSIAKPLGRTVEMIEEMEKGHLSLRLNLDRKDEIGQMAKTLDGFANSLEKEVVDNLVKLANGDLTFTVVPRDGQDLLRGSMKKLNDDLNSIMSEIQIAGEQIAAGSAQVSDSSQSLSQGATESASSLEEIGASLGDMTSQVKQNAENATQVNNLSTEAQQAAERGNQQMQSMVKSMSRINEAGQNISKIIKVIDEIAFQTNLLALNAAVEAARAGQHGKGFAVVAEEVRNLAARSAKAAKETAELIEGSVAITEEGSKIADETAVALGGIVTGITKVADLVAEIAVASNDQAQGIAQVSQGLNQIDQVTQQNTANAEESAAASEELSSQASQLRSMLSRFTIKQSSRSKQVITAKSANDLIVWSDRYATNIPFVDQQHQRLLELINKLYSSMRGGGSKEDVKQSVDALLDYTKTHFGMEEDLMRKHGYPEFNAHKKLHDAFVNQVVDYQRKIKANERVAPADVFNFLKGWLINHIEMKDRDGYTPYLRSKGVVENRPNQAAARPAPRVASGWDTMSRGASSPEQVIALDDSEFGKY